MFVKKGMFEGSFKITSEDKNSFRGKKTLKYFQKVFRDSQRFSEVLKPGAKNHEPSFGGMSWPTLLAFSPQGF